MIVKNFSTRILRGDRLGVIGANGAGKTTLVNLLAGALGARTGVLSGIGANLVLATLDQGRASLDPETVLKDALDRRGSDFVEINGERKHVIGYMKDFLFGPEQARTPIGRLSGGERGRLMLARALGPAIQSPRSRRADQRSRSRNPRSLAGNARRLQRDPAHR